MAAVVGEENGIYANAEHLIKQFRSEHEVNEKLI
jgi:hypothetical protein